MKILFQSQLAPGTTPTQRVEALERDPALDVVRSVIEPRRAGLARRVAQGVAWRTGAPFDSFRENAQLLRLAREHRPDAVIVYNSRTVRASTLRRIREETGAVLAYIAPDDIVSRHNSTVWLRGSYPEWDVLFTSKSYNVGELRAEGVKHPVLNENIFDPVLHRPLAPEEVGDEFEAFDLVFAGTFEPDREESIRKLAEAGFSILIYGTLPGRLHGSWKALERAGVTVRPGVYGIEYTKAIHRGKVPLCFLRKMNRDLITHRSIELPAMARAMLAEKTDEHDARLVDGEEYVGFRSDEEMIEQARRLVEDPALRASIGAAGRARCLSSGYSADADMGRIVEEIRTIAGSRR